MMRDLTVAEHRTALQTEMLDDLLCRWHHWQQQARLTRGYNSRSLVTGDYKVSRQYDDANGALDADIEDTVMRQVDFEVTEMKEPYRSAIYADARALSLGLAVFTSPRLPENPVERKMVMAQARNVLLARLISAGVV